MQEKFALYGGVRADFRVQVVAGGAAGAAGAAGPLHAARRHAPVTPTFNVCGRIDGKCVHFARRAGRRRYGLGRRHRRHGTPRTQAVAGMRVCKYCGGGAWPARRLLPIRPSGHRTFVEANVGVIRAGGASLLSTPRS